MQDGVEPAGMGNIEKIMLVAGKAEELSLTVQKLSKALARGELEDLKNLLNEMKQCVAEIENHLNTLNLE